MTIDLTDRGIKGLKPRDVPFYVSDLKRPGLQLRVALDGSKSWSVRYRVNGRLRRLTLGDFPTIELADARKSAKDARKQALSGADPAEEKQERREADTVADFAERFIEE